MMLPRKSQATPRNHASTCFELRLEGSFDGVRTALADIMQRLRNLDLSDDARGRVELVLAETLNNIAEHGFCDLAQPGFISVFCRQRAGSLSFRITDFGKELPDRALPCRAEPQSGDTLKQMPIDALPEGGFGWSLIHDLAREVTYQRCGPMNALTLSIPTGSQVG